MSFDAKVRTEVIEKSINLESIISALVTSHFFPNQPLPLKFLHGVMCDAYANTSFRLSVFAKCYPQFPRNLLERCRRVFNIRNIFAHCGLVVTNLVDPDKSGVLDPKSLVEPLDFDALAREFHQNYEPVVSELFSLMKAQGIPLDRV
jgi:hypothetical protein